MNLVQEQKGPRVFIILLLPLLLYASGLNPHIMPSQYDNVGYFCGAKSLAESGEFNFQGMHIKGCPPMLPLILSIPNHLGLQSVLAAKVVILLFIAMALLAIYSLAFEFAIHFS